MTFHPRVNQKCDRYACKYDAYAYNVIRYFDAIFFAWLFFLGGVVLVWGVQDFLSIELYHAHPEIYFGIPIGLAIFNFIKGWIE